MMPLTLSRQSRSRMNNTNSQSDNSAYDAQSTFPVVAKWLGYGGLIPFVALALSVAAGVDPGLPGAAGATDSLLNYGAVIISFIGAVHWGLALQAGRDQTLMYVYSVVPALVAWGWLFVAEKTALFGMALTIAVMFFVDRVLLAGRVPAGYLKLRLHLTVIVALSLVLASIGVA